MSSKTERFVVVAHEAANYVSTCRKGDTLGANLIDIHKQRLELMEQYSIEIQVLSLTSHGSPSINPLNVSNSGLSVPLEASKLATAH